MWDERLPRAIASVSVQKLRERPVRVKGATITLSLAIRCGANLLPLKGLIYAIAHARASRHVVHTRKENAQIALRRMAKYMSVLTAMANDLQKMKEVDGKDLYEALRAAVLAYVDMFYQMEEEQRNSFLTSCSSHQGRKITHEQNLLLIPAIMASRGEPKHAVAAYLTNALYKVPFRVLYHSSKAAMHIELLQQAMGLKSAPEQLVKRFSASLANVEKCMIMIDNGKIEPEIDEVLKQEFVDEAVHFSQATDMKIADFISEKVMPNAFTDRLAKRIVRRL